jgi:dihydroorotate dehydrogenase electron transfer subunit
MMAAQQRPHRGSIALIDAEILAQQCFPGQQYVLRLSAPACAARATPGSFAHLACGDVPGMRRPLSIMRRSASEGWVEFLYKPVGTGLRNLARHQPGERISLLGPIGKGFVLDPRRPTVLALGGGVGIPPMVFLADELKEDPRFELVVLMGSELPFPFELATHPAPLAHMPPGASASLALLERWGVRSRLASMAGLEGCYPGYVTGLARHWLDACSPAERERVQILSCGPYPMLEASARLAQAYGIPCQVSVEEYMACAVGGCAGCTVLVHEPQGPAMRRVCVDGPVFEANSIFPPA